MQMGFRAAWNRVSDGGPIHDGKREPVGCIRLGELSVVFVAIRCRSCSDERAAVARPR